MGAPFKSIQAIRQLGIPILTPAAAVAVVEDADLFFCCGTEPISDAIHTITGSPISHVGFLYREQNAVETLESTFTDGVHIGSGSGYLNLGDGACIVARLQDITPEEAEAILKKADTLIGRHYQVGEELEMALHSIIPFMRVKPEWDELFCSGFVEEVLYGTKWPIPLDKSGGNATPVDVWLQPYVIPVCAVVP